MEGVWKIFGPEFLFKRNFVNQILTNPIIFEKLFYKSLYIKFPLTKKNVSTLIFMQQFLLTPTFLGQYGKDEYFQPKM